VACEHVELLDDRLALFSRAPTADADLEVAVVPAGIADVAIEIVLVQRSECEDDALRRGGKALRETFHFR
jgi:hypothetical protein